MNAALTVSPRDRDLLRRLAGRVRELAESDENRHKIALSRKSNALAAERPIIFTHPENAWNEIIPRHTLECGVDPLREWEFQLRQRIFWGEHIRCDRSLHPYLDIPWKISWGDKWGVPIPRVTAGQQPGASIGWSHDFPIKNIAADLPKLRFRQPRVDREGTLREWSLANDLVGDLLPARIHRETYWWTFGLTRDVIDLVGLENLMLLFYDDPGGLHALMRFMCDEMKQVLDWFEREQLLHDNCGADTVGSGGAGHTDELPRRGRPAGAAVRLCDMWGFAESQETVGVSPEMFAEFVLPYQAEIAEKFGLNYYGCCEPLDLRFQMVRTRIPRLRRVSVSPWAGLEKMAEQLGREYVFCRKPLPTPVCAPHFDEEAIRSDLRRTLQVAGRLNLELILKDTHTVCHEPSRIVRWVQIAREEVDRFGSI